MPFLRFSVLLTALWVTLACSTTARAQAPARPATPLPNPPPILPAPTPIPNAPGLAGGTDPTVNAVVTGNPAAPTPTPPEKADVSLEFVNQPIADVIPYYERFSGKHVITDATVQGQITLKVRDITRTQATHIIEKVLSLNGFSLVPAEDDIVQIIGLGKPVRPVGVPIYLDVKDVPNNEQVATLLVRLSYLEPQETQGLLSQYIPPGAVIAFTAIQKAGALLVTDSGRSVRQLYALIQQIDVSPLSVEDRFFRLQRADVTKAIEFLNSVFETKGGGATPGATGNAAIPGTTGTVRRPIRRVGEDGIPNDAAAAALQSGLGGVGTNGDTLIVGRITLTPDIRTNRIHVVTNHRNMDVVKRLLEDFDAETRFATPVRRLLRFVSAQDVLPILVQSITEPGSDSGNGNGTGSTPGATNPNRNGSNSSSNLFNNLNSSNSSNGSSSSGSSGGSNIPSEGLDTQPVDTKPTEATVGNTKLIADQRSNTIIVLGGADAREKIFEVLDQIDVPAPQVVIRTIIGELSLTDDKEFGLNYLLRSKRGTVLSQFNSGQLSTTATAAASPSGSPGSATSALNTAATLAAGLSSSFSGVGGIIAVGNSLDIIASALDSTSRFKTISNPVIFTQNNKKAIIASGQEIAVPTSQVGSSNGTVGGSVGTYTNVEYKNVTLQLEVVPLINSKEINLDILQKIDSIVAGSSTTVNGTQVPTIATRYLKSNVSAPNGSTIVLGGLITQNENRTNGDIPYLSKIPVIGKILFSTRTRDNDRSELIILMHPEVISTPAMLADLREHEGDRSYLGTNLEEQLHKQEVRKAIPVTTTTSRTKTTIRQTTVPLGK